MAFSLGFIKNSISSKSYYIELYSLMNSNYFIINSYYSIYIYLAYCIIGVHFYILRELKKRCKPLQRQSFCVVHNSLLAIYSTRKISALPLISGTLWPSTAPGSCWLFYFLPAFWPAIIAAYSPAELGVPAPAPFVPVPLGVCGCWLPVFLPPLFLRVTQLVHPSSRPFLPALHSSRRAKCRGVECGEASPSILAQLNPPARTAAALPDIPLNPLSSPHLLLLYHGANIVCALCKMLWFEL